MSYDTLTIEEINQLREERLAEMNTPTAMEIRLKLIELFGEGYLHQLSATQHHDIYTLKSFKQYEDKHIKNEYVAMTPFDGGVVHNPGQNNLVYKPNDKVGL